jgi:hypothetical protein
MLTTTRLQLVQIVVTTCGFVFAILQLRSEYKWRRKQIALNMLAEWNNRTGTHRRGIEEELPGLLDADGPDKDVTLSCEQAEEIYFARHGAKNWNLKIHIDELLNYCEYIAVSYENQIGDRSIIKGSLCNRLARWYKELEPYVIVTEAKLNYNPWKPLSDLVRTLPQANQLGQEVRATSRVC